MPSLALFFERNWADEYDIVGLRIVEASVWEEHLAAARVHFNRLALGNAEQPTEEPAAEYLYAGAGREFEFRDFLDYLSAWKVVELTDDEAAVMRKVLSTGARGFLGFAEFLEIVNTDDDEAL